MTIHREDKGMITLMNKQEIILSIVRDGLSQREVHRRTGVDRKTIRKYIREYEAKKAKLATNGAEDPALIEDLVSPSKYKTRNSIKRKLTNETIEEINKYLKENEEKSRTGKSKQQKKKIDIFECLSEKGYEISYSTVCNYIRKIEQETKEADLLKLSLYYGFKYRFCNIAKGNEKGKVERSVEYIRRKVFSKRDTFDSLEEANEYLEKELAKLNSKPINSNDGKSPKEVLDEERKHLLPLMPDYDAARTKEALELINTPQ